MGSESATGTTQRFPPGAAQGIGEKIRIERQAVLAEERARAQQKGQQSMALAVFDKKLQSAKKLAQDLGLTSRQARTRGVSPTAYEAGFQAGHNLNLSSRPTGMLEE